MAEVIEFPTDRCRFARRSGHGAERARVIPLRESAHPARAPMTDAPPSCDDCIHAMLGPVTYCSKFREEILNEELTASECEEFERG